MLLHKNFHCNICYHYQAPHWHLAEYLMNRA